MQKIQYKTPLELQTLIWKGNALVRPEDLAVAEIIDILERSEQLKTLPTLPPGELDLANSHPMWG